MKNRHHLTTKDNAVNILVIDNTLDQLAAAKTQLEALGHTVTCLDSFDAFTLVVMPTNRYLRCHEPKHNFDAVLTDLFMPASPQGLGSYGPSGEKYDSPERKYFVRTSYVDGKSHGVPQPNAPEVPYGIVIAMIAAMGGAKKIGILSIGVTEDGDHHDDPMAWAMDALEHAPLLTEKGHYDSAKQTMTMYDHHFPQNEAEAIVAGDGTKQFTRTFVVNGATMAFFTGYGCPRNYVGKEKFKDWAAALERLMSL